MNISETRARELLTALGYPSAFTWPSARLGRALQQVKAHKKPWAVPDPPPGLVELYKRVCGANSLREAIEVEPTRTEGDNEGQDDQGPVSGVGSGGTEPLDTLPKLARKRGTRASGGVQTASAPPGRSGTRQKRNNEVPRESHLGLPAKKKGKGPLPGPKPGIMAEIVRCLLMATEEAPVTREDIHAELVQKFPFRDPDSMASTVRCKVPFGLHRIKGLDVRQNKEGFWIPAPE